MLLVLQIILLVFIGFFFLASIGTRSDKTKCIYLTGGATTTALLLVSLFLMNGG